MNRTQVLDRARSVVCGDRDHNYGGPEKSFECIAGMWSSYLEYATGQKQCITAADVAAMMALLKIARIAKSPDHEDSWVDLAGYAACGGECGCALDQEDDDDQDEQLILRAEKLSNEYCTDYDNSCSQCRIKDACNRWDADKSAESAMFLLDALKSQGYK